MTFPSVSVYNIVANFDACDKHDMMQVNNYIFTCDDMPKKPYMESEADIKHAVDQWVASLTRQDMRKRAKDLKKEEESYVSEHGCDTELVYSPKKSQGRQATYMGLRTPNSFG